MSVRLNDMTNETIIRSIGIDNNSMEKTLHGSSDFPVAVYNTTLSNFHLGYVDWHWHNELQLCLVTTDLSITEIAVNCGFSTSSYYIKHFRESCGHSPSAYRKAHKADEPEKK